MPSMSEPSAITGLPLPHVAIQAVGMPDDAAGDREAVLLENAGEVLRGLDLLEAELAEAEDRIDGILRQLGQSVDMFGHPPLQGGEVGLGRGRRRRLGDGRGLRQRRRGAHHGCGNSRIPRSFCVPSCDPPGRQRAPCAAKCRPRRSARIVLRYPRQSVRMRWRLAVATGVAAAAMTADLPARQPAVPTARLVSAAKLTLPGRVDSSNPWSGSWTAPRRCSRRSAPGAGCRRSPVDLASTRWDWPVMHPSSPIRATACGSRRWSRTPTGAGMASITTSVRPTTVAGQTGSCRERGRPFERSGHDLGGPRHRHRRAARHRRLRLDQPFHPGRGRRRDRRARSRRAGSLPLLQRVPTRPAPAGRRRRAAGVGRPRRARRQGGDLERRRLAPRAVGTDERRHTRGGHLDLSGRHAAGRGVAAVSRRPDGGERLLGAVDPLEHLPRAVRDAAQPRQGRALRPRGDSTCRSRRRWPIPRRGHRQRRS